MVVVVAGEIQDVVVMEISMGLVLRSPWLYPSSWVLVVRFLSLKALMLSYRASGQ